MPIDTNILLAGDWCQPVGVFEPGENFVPQTLLPTAFETYSHILEVDTKAETLTTTAFGFISSYSTLTIKPLKSYIVSWLTLLNLENQIYQGFQMRAVPINLNPYQGLKRYRRTNNRLADSCVPINLNPYQGLKPAVEAGLSLRYIGFQLT